MADPTAYLTTKIAAAIGGFMGGAAIMSFIKPKSVGEAFVRGGVSVGSSIIFAGPALTFLNLNPDWDMQLMSGSIVGFVAYSVLGMIANFLAKNKDRDIVDVVSTIKTDLNK